MGSEPGLTAVTLRETRWLEDTLEGPTHETLRLEHLKAYLSWIRRWLRFYESQDPALASKEEITRFLSDPAVNRKVAPATQNQALCAVVFFYTHVLGLELDWLDDLVKAKKTPKLPVVLNQSEVTALFARLEGVTWLMASLMYGSGLRLMECARLRVKDIDFERNEITVRDGKGRKDRVTMLPAKLKNRLSEHLKQGIASFRSTSIAAGAR